MEFLEYLHKRMWIYLILCNPFQMHNNIGIISISGNEDRIILENPDGNKEKYIF